VTILDLEFTRVKERMSAKSFEEFLVKQEAAAAHKRALVQISEERLAKNFNPKKINPGEAKEDAWLSNFSAKLSFSVKKRPLSVQLKHDKVGPNSPASAAGSPISRRPATALGRMEGAPSMSMTDSSGEFGGQSQLLWESRPRIQFHKYSDAFEERASIALQNRLTVLRGASPKDWHGKTWQEGAVMTPLLDRNHPMYAEFKDERKKIIGKRPVPIEQLAIFVGRQERKNLEKMAGVAQKQDEQIRTAIKPALCPKGHVLDVKKTFGEWTCHGCGDHPEGVKQHRHCKTCEYNLCKLCFEAKVTDERGKTLTPSKERDLLQRIGAEAAEQRQRRLRQQIKKDLTEDLGFVPFEVFGKEKVVRYRGRSWSAFLERQRQAAKQRFSRQPYYG